MRCPPLQDNDNPLTSAAPLACHHRNQRPKHPATLDHDIEHKLRRIPRVVGTPLPLSQVHIHQPRHHRLHAHPQRFVHHTMNPLYSHTDPPCWCSEYIKQLDRFPSRSMIGSLTGVPSVRTDTVSPLSTSVRSGFGRCVCPINLLCTPARRIQKRCGVTSARQTTSPAMTVNAPSSVSTIADPSTTSTVSSQL